MSLLDLLVPPRCAGCALPGSWLCLDCRNGLDPVGRSAGGLAIAACGTYAGPLRQAIHSAKYGDQPALAEELGLLLAERIAGDLARGARLDAIVPVRLHPGRRRERGYDQTFLLAAVAARHTDLPLVPALHRIRGGTAQVRLDRAGRAANVRSAFVGEAGALRGGRVALVDDVATTGATLCDAAAAARACGARTVRAYVLALDE